MTELILSPIGLILAIVVYGLFQQWLKEDSVAPVDHSGWAYFISSGKGPIKVGTSPEDPSVILRQTKTANPFPVKMVYKFKVRDRQAVEQSLRQQLHPHRLNGEWYDRDATLALISHIKGEYR